MTLVLLAVGTGLGLSVVSPWAGSGVSATTFKITTGLYLIVIAMIAPSIGGYLAVYDGNTDVPWFLSGESGPLYLSDRASRRPTLQPQNRAASRIDFAENRVITTERHFAACLNWPSAFEKRTFQQLI
jgi:hypothetical protein